LSEFLNLLNTEVESIISAVIVSETFVEERNKGIKNKVLQQRDTDIHTSVRLEYSHNFIEVLNDF
jgi:hypothetical protein